MLLLILNRNKSKIEMRQLTGYYNYSCQLWAIQAKDTNLRQPV